MREFPTGSVDSLLLPLSVPGGSLQLGKVGGLPKIYGHLHFTGALGIALSCVSVSQMEFAKLK